LTCACAQESGEKERRKTLHRSTGEQDSGPSHPANTKGSGYLGTMGSSWWRRPSLREGELLSDSDPSRARCAYEDEPRQSTGVSRTPVLATLPIPKGVGIWARTAGSGGEQDSGPSRPAMPASTGEQLLESEDMGVMGSPGAARTCAAYTHNLITKCDFKKQKKLDLSHLQNV
jgi:hypothetical protein